MQLPLQNISAHMMPQGARSRADPRMNPSLPLGGKASNTNSSIRVLVFFFFVIYKEQRPFAVRMAVILQIVACKTLQIRSSKAMKKKPVDLNESLFLKNLSTEKCSEHSGNPWGDF